MIILLRRLIFLLLVYISISINLFSFGKDISSYVIFKPVEKVISNQNLLVNLKYDGPFSIDFIIYFKCDKNKSYFTSPFSKNGHDSYIVSIPGSKIYGKKFYYYIEGVDRDGNSYKVSGTYKKPLLINVSEATKENSAAIADDFLGEELSPFDEELQLLQAENVVFSASQFAQSVLEAPASISYIKWDYIKKIGGNDLADILLFMPGIDVVRMSASDYQINPRGFDREINNKMLALVDGRSIYFDFFGFSMFEAIPLVLTDIDRIEIVKGPVSAIYGANAWSGVLNIVTKDPKKEQGTNIYLSDGLLSDKDGSFLNNDSSLYRNSFLNIQQSGYRKKNFYRLSMGFKNDGDSQNPSLEVVPSSFACEECDNSLGLQKIFFNSKWGYSFSKEKEFVFEAGYSVQKGNILTELNRYGTEGPVGYIQGIFLYNNLKISTFYNHLFSYAYSIYNPDVSDLPAYSANGEDISLSIDPLVMKGFVLNNVVDINIKHQVKFSVHNLHYGLGYRYNYVKSPQFFSQEHSQNLFNGFILDEIKFGSKNNYIVNLALRYDRHPLTGDHISPRIAFVLKPTDNQSIRVSVGRAFRNPTFIESYMNFALNTVIAVAPDGTVLNPPKYIVSPQKAIIRGNEELKSEENIGFDTTYQYLKEGFFHLSLDGFYNKFINLIVYQTVEDGKTFQNLGQGYEYGGEVSLKFFITKYFEIWSNYSYEKTIFTYDDPETLENENGDNERSPTHKANLLFFTKFKAFNGNIQLHYESEKTKYNDDDFVPYIVPAVDITATNPAIIGGVQTSPDIKYTIPEYYLINISLSYDITKYVTFSLYVNNLLNNVHKEYPRDEAAYFYRKIYGKLSLEF